MSVENQLTETDYSGLGSAQGFSRIGQKVTISSRTINSLAFKLAKLAGATGNITMTIRSTSDDSVLASKVWGDASTLNTDPGDGSGTYTWATATFTTPVLVNEEVYLCCEYWATGSVYYRFSATSVKASERLWLYPNQGGPWNNGGATDGDATYSYDYDYAGAITTQQVTNLAATTATGNGNITNLGAPAATQHGHCWNTTGTPTTADSKTTNGVPAATGAFTSSITGLTSGTTYYCRAYITNSEGTTYGNQIAFTAGVPSGMIKGNIAVRQTRLHYIGTDGREYYIQGIPTT